MCVHMYYTVYGYTCTKKTCAYYKFKFGVNRTCTHMKVCYTNYLIVYMFLLIRWYSRTVNVYDERELGDQLYISTLPLVFCESLELLLLLELDAALRLFPVVVLDLLVILFVLIPPNVSLVFSTTLLLFLFRFDVVAFISDALNTDINCGVN